MARTIFNMELRTEIICRCERIRRNNGIMEILFTKRAGNGAEAHEEHGLFNLLSDRGTPEHGRLYKITIEPVNE